MARTSNSLTRAIRNIHKKRAETKKEQKLKRAKKSRKNVAHSTDDQLVHAIWPTPQFVSNCPTMGCIWQISTLCLFHICFVTYLFSMANTNAKSEKWMSVGKGNQLGCIVQAYHWALHFPTTIMIVDCVRCAKVSPLDSYKKWATVSTCLAAPELGFLTVSAMGHL